MDLRAAPLRLAIPLRDQHARAGARGASRVPGTRTGRRFSRVWRRHEGEAYNRPMNSLSDLAGTRWIGTAELWLDPLGDAVLRSDCTISLEADVVRYTWSHEGESHEGSITLGDDSAQFTDTWHQPQPMTCRRLADARGLFQVQGAYGPESDWGWRTGLSHRTPTGELVLQMTNVAPWGEEARAVRMVCKQDG